MRRLDLALGILAGLLFTVAVLLLALYAPLDGGHMVPQAPPSRRRP